MKAAAEVFTRVKIDASAVDKKTRQLTLISRATEADWQWLTELLLERDWSVTATEAAVQAVNQLGTVPALLTDWLNPNKYKKEAALEAAAEGQSPTAQKVAMWVQTATEAERNDFVLLVGLFRLVRISE